MTGAIERQGRCMRRIRPAERLAFAVGRNLVHDPLVASTRVDVACAIDCQRPDVLVLGIEEHRALAVAIDIVNAAVRRRADVDTAIRRESQRMHFELSTVEEHRAFALRVDPEHFAFVAGADEQRAIRLSDHRPEERRGGFIHQLRRRSERQLPVTVDREVVDVAFEEIGLRGGLEELRCRGPHGRGREDGGDSRRTNDQFMHDESGNNGSASSARSALIVVGDDTTRGVSSARSST